MAFTMPTTIGAPRLFILLLLYILLSVPIGHRHRLQNYDTDLPEIIKTSDMDVWWTSLIVILIPFYWNLVSRAERNWSVLGRCLGSRWRGYTCLALTFMALAIYRVYRYQMTVVSHARWVALMENWILWTGHSLFLCGVILLLSSFYVVGFTSGFLGVYCEGLLPVRASRFPYSLMNNPIQWGSSMAFLGASLVQASYIGVCLSGVIAVMYNVSYLLERSFLEKEKVS